MAGRRSIAKAVGRRSRCGRGISARADFAGREIRCPSACAAGDNGVAHAIHRHDHACARFGRPGQRHTNGFFCAADDIIAARLANSDRHIGFGIDMHAMRRSCHIARCIRCAHRHDRVIGAHRQFAGREIRAPSARRACGHGMADALHADNNHSPCIRRTIKHNPRCFFCTRDRIITARLTVVHSHSGFGVYIDHLGCCRRIAKGVGRRSGRDRAIRSRRH